MRLPDTADEKSGLGRRHHLDRAAEYPPGDDQECDAKGNAAELALAANEPHAEQEITDATEAGED